MKIYKRNESDESVVFLFYNEENNFVFKVHYWEVSICGYNEIDFTQYELFDLNNYIAKHTQLIIKKICQFRHPLKDINTIFILNNDYVISIENEIMPGKIFKEILVIYNSFDNFKSSFDYSLDNKMLFSMNLSANVSE